MGAAVTAYGQDTDGRLRIAHGTVRAVVNCAGCARRPISLFPGRRG